MSRKFPPPQPASPTTTKPRQARSRRLSALDKYQILELHRARPDLSYADLARLVGRDKDTVRLTCMAAGKGLADLMAADASQAIDLWREAATVAARRGDHRPAKEWLLHAGVLEQLPDAGKGSGPAVVIINAPLPGMPGYTAPVPVPVPVLPAAVVPGDDGPKGG